MKKTYTNGSMVLELLCYANDKAAFKSTQGEYLWGRHPEFNTVEKTVTWAWGHYGYKSADDVIKAVMKED